MANSRLCSIDACGKPVLGRGWCSTHYSRWRTHGSPLLGGWPKAKCSIEGCDRPTKALGLCSMHHKRQTRHGNPLGGGTAVGQPKSFIDKAISHDEPGICLNWPFSRTKGGYGKLVVNGRLQYAHRIVCSKVHGSPPSEDHQAGHTCHNGHLGCVNPHHLQWITPEDNLYQRDQNQRFLKRGS